MNLFIDTNVFLSFYHFANDDLEELEKLVILLKEGEVSLHVPQQVEDEFQRNRHNKINESIKKLREQKLPGEFPQLCKDFEEYSELKSLRKEYAKKHAQLLEKIEEQVWQESLKADKVVMHLFKRAKKIENSDSITNKARLRFDVGNPPGKKNSLGDAINWETLLSEVPQNEDLFFISDDKDFFSPLDEDVLNFFLEKEWESTKDSKIICYRSLSAFFKDHYPDIGLAIELEKDLCIKRLAASRSFAETHTVVRKLKKFGDFTATQVNTIVEAAVTNTQVSWVIQDKGIYSFFEKLISSYKEQIEEENLHKLLSCLKFEFEPPESFWEEDR